jgi:tetratricopeptide (TPR) repeat protein
VAVLAALSGFSAAAARGSNPGLPADPSLGQQIRFGVDMAERGLWSEALFRFEQAARLAPDDAQVLGNIAVSYEAIGRFDDALAAYKKALAAAPDNRDLKRNYARFIEFYQSFRPGALKAAAGAPGAAPESVAVAVPAPPPGPVELAPPAPTPADPSPAAAVEPPSRRR